MKIEAGKYYRTRGGEKALVTDRDKDPNYPWNGRIGDKALNWTEEGPEFLHHVSQHDLVAEWVDEPSASDRALQAADEAIERLKQRGETKRLHRALPLPANLVITRCSAGGYLVRDGFERGPHFEMEPKAAFSDMASLVVWLSACEALEASDAQS